MIFPQQFPSLTIPTGAGPGQQRITINDNQDGAILVYDSTGALIVSIASAAGTDSVGNAYQAGVTTYGVNTTINVLEDDIVLTANNGSKAILESGNNASLFLTPIQATGPFSAGAVTTNIGGGNHPGMQIASPSDTVNGKFSDIILQGSSSTDARTIILSLASFWNHTGTFQINSSDIGSGIQAVQEITANISGLGVTETTVMTLPSMTFQNGRAYRVHLWGLQQSTTADTYFLHQFRSGTGTGGTLWKQQMRVPTVNVASVNSAVDLTFLLVNNTGADITTTSTWTTSCASGTGILAASAGNHATATIEDVGLASQWVGQPIS